MFYLFLYLIFFFNSVKSSLAQLAERKTVNLEAAGSIPAGRVSLFRLMSCFLTKQTNKSFYHFGPW
jgi:hypothetical protein